MRVKEVSATAVIPTAQYANVQTTVTVEVDNDIEAAKAEALRIVEEVSARYAEPGKALPQLHQNGPAPQAGPALVELRSDVTGGTAFFDEAAHVYTNRFGQKLLSGSEFAKQFCPEFNADFILPKMEAKHNVPAADIRAMWAKKAEASRFLGDAIHAAMELFGKYRITAALLDKDKPDTQKAHKHLHNHPVLHHAVSSFFAAREPENALYEPFIVHEDSRLCGRIDRLVITGEKRGIIDDWKTNAGDLTEQRSPKFFSAPFTDLPNTQLNEYFLQESFYAYILQLAGWTIEQLRIHQYDGQNWKTYTSPVIDISGAQILQTIQQQ